MTPPLSAGVIAAGEGSRLRDSHPGLVKPMIPVAGRPLCHWVARGLTAAGAARVTVLTNSRGRAVHESLRQAFPGAAWTFLVADTASSWESFRLVSRTLAETAEDFLISTADSLMTPEDVAAFAAGARAGGREAGLALTRFVDDEKPLWADRSPDGRISALGGTAPLPFVTAGLYYLRAGLARRMPEAAAHASLRSYWKSLLDSGVAVEGVEVGKTLDVDRPEDLAQAEGFLKSASLEARS